MPRVYCASCGARLVGGGGAGGWGRRCWLKVRRLVRQVVVLGLVVMLGLVLWPMEVEVAMGSAGAGGKAGEKLGELLAAVEGGRAAERTFSEGELNAFLRLAAGEGGRGRMAVRLGEGRGMVWFCAELGGGVAMTQLYVVEGGQGGHFRGGGMRAGHLPVPRVVAGLLARGRILPRWRRHSPDLFRILDHATDVRMGGGEVTIGVCGGG